MLLLIILVIILISLTILNFIEQTKKYKERRKKKMGNDKFIEICKSVVADYANKHLDKSDNKKIGLEDVFIVWSCKTLQNNKALLSTTLLDGMYYELTHNGDEKEIYFDAYKKFENRCIKLEGENK